MNSKTSKEQSLRLKQGFTLVETLVALGILSVILVVIVNSFLSVLTRSSKSRVIKLVESDGKYALRIMELMIRNSTEIIENPDQDHLHGHCQPMKALN